MHDRKQLWYRLWKCIRKFCISLTQPIFMTAALRNSQFNSMGLITARNLLFSRKAQIKSLIQNWRWTASGYSYNDPWIYRFMNLVKCLLLLFPSGRSSSSSFSPGSCTQVVHMHAWSCTLSLVFMCCKYEPEHKEPWFVFQNYSDILAYKILLQRLATLSNRALTVRDENEEAASVTSYPDM